MGSSNLSDKSLSLGDEEFPVLWDRLLISKEQAANLTDEQKKDLLQKWGEDLSTSTSQESVQDPSGYVYLARTRTVDHGVVHKIGESEEPEDRVQVFDTKMPVDVEIVNCFPVDDSARVESILQDRYDTDHVKGEWYNLDDIALAGLAHATGFEDGELTYTPEALIGHWEDLGEVFLRNDKLLDKIVEDSPSDVLCTFMKLDVLAGSGGVLEEMMERVVAEERTEVLGRFQYWYWGDFRMESSPPSEWDIAPQRVVETVLFVLLHHPEQNERQLQRLARALFERCQAAPERTDKIIRAATGSYETTAKLLALLMPYHPKAEAYFEERSDGVKQ